MGDSGRPNFTARNLDVYIHEWRKSELIILKAFLAISLVSFSFLFKAMEWVVSEKNICGHTDVELAVYADAVSSGSLGFVENPFGGWEVLSDHERV